MDYSIEHARVKEMIENAQCSGDSPNDLVNCITEQLKTAGYTPTTVQLLDSNVDPVERPEQTRFIRIEAQRGGDKNIHIFTFAVLKPGGVYKALWLQSAVVEK
jgi:superfamily II helicase